MQKGFTLIETMVVVSIIGMLSSTILAALNQTRVSGRDSARLQQARQIDLGVQLYIADMGHPPDLQGNCGKNVNLNGQNVSDCIAISTAGAGSENSTAWNLFRQDLAPYISQIPADPCGINGCTNSSGQRTGYRYYSPAAVRYYCSSNCNDDDDDDDYELEITNEDSGDDVSGSGGSSYPFIFEYTLGANRGDEVTVTGSGFNPWPIEVHLDPVAGGGGMTISPPNSGKVNYFEFTIPLNAELGPYDLSVTTANETESNIVPFTIH